jgi:hypothetical protein
MAQSGEGNEMALMPLRIWARVPSTLASNCAALLVDIPLPCSRSAQGGKGALCSPVGGKGRLVLTTWVSLSTAEMVKAPARMPAHNQVSMPSQFGREGINGTGVSCHPEANWMISSWLYCFNCRKEKYCTKPSTAQSG